MSEYELVYLASEYINRTWQLLQFWASVSFGLLAVSYLAAKHLNLAMAVVLTLLYCSFTLFIMTMLGLNGEVVDGFITDLAALDSTDKGSALTSQGAQKIVTTSPGPLPMALIVSAFFGTFVSTLYFLWRSFLSTHKTQNPETLNEKGSL